MSVVWIKQKKSKSYGTRTKKPFITISNKTTNKIYINSKAMQDLLNNTKYVKVGIDNIKKRMYIKQTTLNDINAMKLKESSNSQSALINSTRISKKLCKVAGIESGNTERYELKELKNGMYYADFTRPMDDMEGEVVNDWE